MSQSTSRPTLNVVAAIPARKEGGETRFVTLGVAFPHKKGLGYNVELDALPFEWERLLAFPRKAKGAAEGAPTEPVKLEGPKLTVHARVPLKEGEILTPCGVVFVTEKGTGLSLVLNTLPRDWRRLVLLPEGETPQKVPEAVTDDLAY